MFSTRLQRIALAVGCATACSLFIAPTRAAQPAAHAHVHGIASVDVAIEDKTITIQMSSPLDNILGFERAPHEGAERQAADAAVAKLSAGATAFAIDPAAHCVLKSVDLSSSALKLGHPDPSEAAEGHADIDGTYEFTCAKASDAKFIDLGLFDFAHMQKVTAQVVTAHGQFKRDLVRPARRIDLSH
jgi:hypothetical protein